MKKMLIYGEAQINPQYCNSNGIDVRVCQGGEGPLPHVHVYWNGFSRCAYVDLTKPRYAKHHKDKSDVMPKSIKSKFIENMNSTWNASYIEDFSGIHKATGYEAAVLTWCDTYENGDFSKFKFGSDGRLCMPDYRNL